MITNLFVIFESPAPKPKGGPCMKNLSSINMYCQAQPKLNFNGTGLKLSLIPQFSDPAPPTKNSKDYTFQEAEIWHASSNGPS